MQSGVSKGAIGCGSVDVASEYKSASNGNTQSGGGSAAFLEQSWKADPAKVKDGDPSIASGMSPAWRMFLLGNGSPTRHLRLLTGRRTRVEVIEMKEVGDVVDPLAPAEVKLVPSPRLRRQVFLKTDDGVILGYAVSYWNVQKGEWWRSSCDLLCAAPLLSLTPVPPVHQHLKDKSVPIFTSFTGERAELFREINGLYCGKSDRLAKAFSADTGGGIEGAAGAGGDGGAIAAGAKEGPTLYGRHYTFYHGGRPLTVIIEVYNERTLSPFLGKILLNE